MKFSLLILVASLVLVTCEDSQCSTAFDKSAVTREAAEEAAKAKKKQPILNNEVYSSKVKSKPNKLSITIITALFKRS